MDGDGDGGGMDSMNGTNMGNANVEAMQNANDESSASTLESMGYVDSGTSVEQSSGDSTRPWKHILQTALILTLTAIIVGATGYYLLSFVLSFLGITL
ncbi:hypothetical protein ACFQMA_20405 [Halosimplex aquaticum]|uniref:Uncharacterized protein n=1 Tax=Halosimplex aquaticum TaxID=3026162 RepID=A0ABD5Y5M5_9EURY|nr:hypothetical protein [Halosimplex aquaticum]